MRIVLRLNNFGAVRDLRVLVGVVGLVLRGHAVLGDFQSLPCRAERRHQTRSHLAGRERSEGQFPASSYTKVWLGVKPFSSAASLFSTEPSAARQTAEGGPQGERSEVN